LQARVIGRPTTNPAERYSVKSNSTSLLVILLVVGMGWSGRVSAQVSVQPGNVLQISVWPATELSGDFVVEDSGIVYLPLIGEVRVGGMGIDEVRGELRRRYGEVVRNPVVSIIPLFPVTITGEVQRPGLHMVTPANSVLDVISMAGGLRERADADDIRVVRRGEVIEFNALRVLETGQGMDAIQLRSGDHIVIPQGRLPWTWRDALYVVQTISTIVLLVDRFR
jgi:polysaccharide biosynthesis/export protein